jgi:anti-sigma-K factor RskA
MALDRAADGHVSDFLPGYVLGALDEEELLLVARHLSGCAACRQELAGYRAAVNALGSALPTREPSPALRAKVVRRIANSRKPVDKPVAAAEAGPTVFTALRRVFAQRTSAALATLAMLLIVALAGSTYTLYRQVSALQAERSSSSSMRLVQLTGTENAPLAAGYLLVFADENYGALVVNNAPALEAGYQYQIWLVKDGQRSNGGVFSVDADGYATLQIDATRPLDEYQSFGITREPSGGSPGPTGPKVLGGGL